VLIAAVLGAAGLAYFLTDHGSASSSGSSGAAATAIADPPPASPMDSTALPPNHPPVDLSGGGMSPHGAPPASPNEAAAITWKAPGEWKAVPNPNAMRIATYSVGEGTELSVARAGGSTEANIERWLGQFDGAGRDERTEKTVHGLKVTVVQVAGTYLSGGMGGAPTPHPGWALLAAIVEGQGSPYFFKMVGPEAQVRAARKSFDALVDSVAPSS
jgi:hypothetical protein